MGAVFPNVPTGYPTARNALLASEVALRRQMEAVAADVRALLLGGQVSEDYEFNAVGAHGAPAKARLSELFRDGDKLMLYRYMFPRHSLDQRAGPTSGATAQLPLSDGPCPSCTALIDMWKGVK